MGELETALERTGSVLGKNYTSIRRLTAEQTKKASILRSRLLFSWRPQGDLNPCRLRERALSGPSCPLSAFHEGYGAKKGDGECSKAKQLDELTYWYSWDK